MNENEQRLVDLMDARRREEQLRNPIIDFDTPGSNSSGPGPRLGSSGPVAGFLVSTGTILGILAMTVGAFIGQAKAWWIAPIVMVATMAPFYAVAWLLSRNGQPKSERAARSPMAVVATWTVIGAAVGVLLGLATPVVLGADISAMEGLRVFAPASVLVGLVVGFFRRPKRIRA